MTMPRSSPRRSCHLIMGRTIRFIPKLYITISVDAPSTTIRLDIATPKPWLLTPPSVSRAANSHLLPGCSAVIFRNIFQNSHPLWTVNSNRYSRIKGRETLQMLSCSTPVSRLTRTALKQGYGVSRILPVVSRPSSLRWASWASDSGSSRPTYSLTSPDCTQRSTSSARCVSSSRVAV